MKNLKTILFILILLGITVNGHAKGRGYGDAPQCETDIYRNFSVTKAFQAINQIGSLGTGPLEYPKLGRAKSLMHEAWTNLEQVMNLGALKWSKYCVTCDPRRYLQAAEALVQTSRNVYGNPNYGEFLGLVDTMKSNIQSMNYCGFYAGRVNTASVVGKWEFGQLPNKKHTSNFNLSSSSTPMGPRITGYSNPNERFYWLLGEELVFVHQDGSVTSVLRKGSSDYWEGPYVPDRRIGHYIKRVKFPDLQGTWYCQINCPAGGIGKAASIAQTGDRLQITNEGGNVSNGHFLDASNISADGWGITGNITDRGRKIVWSNGTEWVR